MKNVIVLLLCLIFFSGCYETRRQSYSERKGLMLLEKHEYSRNQGIYKPAKKYKKNISKKIKKQQQRKSY